MVFLKLQLCERTPTTAAAATTMVPLQNHHCPLPKVYLRYQQHKLDHESPSAVQFTLNSESRHDFVKSDGRGYYYLCRQLPITGPAVQIDGLPLGHNSVGHSLISNQMLSQLPMEDNVRGLLTHQICSTVDALIDRKDTDGTNKLWLIDVKIQLVTLVEEFEEGERAADYERRYMRGSGVRPNYNGMMIPATWSSISHLEQVIHLHNGESKEESSCPICLGDLPTASYVTRMPCLHVFHVKCIVKWLTGSHYCPICRFQMPT